STGTARLSVENDGSVLLDVNGAPSSHLHPDPEHLVFEYMRWMLLVIDRHLAELPAPAPSGGASVAAAQLAHLGGGGCSLPRAVAARDRQSRQSVVEGGGLLAQQGGGWFELAGAPELALRTGGALGRLAGWGADP